VLASDLEGRTVLDLACATGAHAIHAKQRGAAQVVGVERDKRRYAKALELKKVVIRHSDVDARVDVRLGDVRELLPTLGRFDTLMFFGVIHYFEDYEAVLAELAAATKDVMYVEFAFSEGDHDTAGAPGRISAYTRPKSGTVIYMGDRDAVAGAIASAIPEFLVEERTLISPPGRTSQREIWRLRRRALGLNAA
jgi:SAM-dependent methyltransferase